MGFNDSKSRDRKFGIFAEQIASEYYIKLGYVVLERNWRLNKTEIDLIVQKGNTIVFVEVKARSGEDMDPIESVSRDKMKRMIRASDVYIRGLTGEYFYQFDIFGLTGDFENYDIEVYHDAFMSSDIY